jgi:subtilisin-like proprotein convertase family protein
MKMNLTILAVLVLALTARATLYSYTYTPGTSVTIPDANPTGVAFTMDTSGNVIPATINGGAPTVQNVDVRLNISGGYNGDLYGYLVMQPSSGGPVTALLLNHPGVGNATFGNSGSSMVVTLSSSGTTDIHNALATGDLGGTYQPEGNGSMTFGGANAAGATWTLFLADLSGGDTSRLVSWGLDISVVPEPITYSLMIFGAVVMTVAIRRRQAVSKVA